MKRHDLPEDRPINLEESSIIELKRVAVTDEESPSTRPPVMPPKPHAPTDHRELLLQPFEAEEHSA